MTPSCRPDERGSAVTDSTSSFTPPRPPPVPPSRNPGGAGGGRRNTRAIVAAVLAVLLVIAGAVVALVFVNRDDGVPGVAVAAGTPEPAASPEREVDAAPAPVTTASVVGSSTAASSSAAAAGACIDGGLEFRVSRETTFPTCEAMIAQWRSFTATGGTETRQGDWICRLGTPAEPGSCALSDTDIFFTVVVRPGPRRQHLPRRRLNPAAPAAVFRRSRAVRPDVPTGLRRHRHRRAVLGRSRRAATPRRCRRRWTPTRARRTCAPISPAAR